MGGRDFKSGHRSGEEEGAEGETLESCNEEVERDEEVLGKVDK